MGFKKKQAPGRRTFAPLLPSFFRILVSYSWQECKLRFTLRARDDKNSRCRWGHLQSHPKNVKRVISRVGNPLNCPGAGLIKKNIKPTYKIFSIDDGARPNKPNIAHCTGPLDHGRVTHVPGVEGRGFISK